MQQLSLLIVMLAALIIPIIMARFKVSSIPTAIAEIITGIILGKSFLNIVNPNWTLNMMSSMGVIMLMFLSGMEINFDLFRKTPGKKRDSKSPVVMASQAFGLIIAAALIIAIVISRLGLIQGCSLGDNYLFNGCPRGGYRNAKGKGYLAKTGGPDDPANGGFRRSGPDVSVDFLCLNQWG